MRRFYDYLEKRGGVKMVMQVPPSRIQVLDTIKKLGFEIVEKQTKTRSKDYKVFMEAKSD